MTKTLSRSAAVFAVIALTGVQHDGVLYGPDSPNGDRFTLKAAEAEPLLAVGAVAIDEAEMRRIDDEQREAEHQARITAANAAAEQAKVAKLVEADVAAAKAGTQAANLERVDTAPDQAVADQAVADQAAADQAAAAKTAAPKKK